MSLIPKDLIDKYFRCKYAYYRKRQKYNSNESIDGINSFEYYVYLHNPKYYQDLILICNEIKLYIKNALDVAIELEQHDDHYQYYKLRIKYAYNHEEIQHYESPILKAISILHVYKYLLFNESLDDIKLLEAFMGMTDCFNVSKITNYNVEFHTVLWRSDSYYVNDINMFAKYDEVLRDRYYSVAIELESLHCSDDKHLFDDVIFKYPKSENDKVVAKLCIEKTQIKKDVLSQLYKCDTIEPIIQNDIEYYDLLHALHKFFICDFMGKIQLDILEENQVYLTI